MNYKTKYKQQLADILYTTPNNIYFYWKGRVALYAILKAMGIKNGDEVILPGFTCVVVPNAIKYLGAAPVYVDINKDTLNTDIEKIKPVITEKTKVIICQNTFGLSSQVDEIAAFAKSKNIYTIEDCTHGFGGSYNGKPNGTFCDAAFFSTQWNKSYSTGIGGFSLINNNELNGKIDELNQYLIKPGFIETFSLQLMIKAKETFLNSSNYWRLRRIYRLMSKAGIVTGSSKDSELKNTLMPVGYFKSSANIQLKTGSKNIQNLNHLLTIRKRNAILYTELLSSAGKYHVKEELHNNHSFLKYPALVSNRKEFEKIAEENNIVLDNWFCSPLHPVDDKFSIWELNLKSVPIASEISSQIINLPLEMENISEVLLFMKKNINMFV